MMEVNGATRLAVIVGDPIAQVKSPAGMTASLQEAGLNTVVMPAHVQSAELSGFIKGVSMALNMDAIIVTVPHKFACYRHCATVTPRARVLEAVNIMRRNLDGTWHGEMFDGPGFVGGLRSQGGDPAGKRTLLVGAGGAGSAIALSLLDEGATSLDIHDADPARRDTLITRLERLHPGKLGIGSSDPTGYDLVCNASPAGMRLDDPYPVQVAKLAPSTFVGCVITAPAVSPWVAAARARGCRGSVGVDMYQAEQALMRDFLLGRETAL
jgi:shikimate dehydrogenase